MANGNVATEKIIQCAQCLSANSVQILADLLDNTIRNSQYEDDYSEDWGYTYAVLKYIASSGFDISNWTLSEIPLPNVYYFSHVDHKKNRQQFILCVEENDNGSVNVIPAYTRDDGYIISSKSIIDAIDKTTLT